MITAGAGTDESDFRIPCKRHEHDDISYVLHKSRLPGAMQRTRNAVRNRRMAAVINYPTCPEISLLLTPSSIATHICRISTDSRTASRAASRSVGRHLRHEIERKEEMADWRKET